MNKNPLTDRGIGIPGFASKQGFSEIRAKAKKEYEERHIKSKRNRKEPAPEYKIDQEIVIAKGYYRGNRDYILIRIVDFEKRNDSFIYYGIVLKVTDPSKLERVGRLISTDSRWFGYCPANVGPEKIKWLEQKD